MVTPASLVQEIWGHRSRGSIAPRRRRPGRMPQGEDGLEGCPPVNKAGGETPPLGPPDAEGRSQPALLDSSFLCKVRAGEGVSGMGVAASGRRETHGGGRVHAEGAGVGHRTKDRGGAGGQWGALPACPSAGVWGSPGLLSPCFP